MTWPRPSAGAWSTAATRDRPGYWASCRTRAFGSAFLLPEFELEIDVQEWVEENATWLFEFQLSAWTDDESTWPADRDLAMFREWFRVDIHNVVVDMGENEIEGEEL